MKYLNFPVDELTRLGAIHTAREISQQPALWLKIWEEANARRSAIEEFFHTTQPVRRIILTGAGTSAFIGLSLRGAFQRGRGILTEAISTTDLVSHPQDYLLPEVPTLLVSFARSGNSPESAAAVRIADEICRQCFHLVITCNPEGLLAMYPSPNPKYVYTLPAEANDQSLAMTSSYSGMLLAGKLLANIDTVADQEPAVQTLARYAERVLTNNVAELKEIAALDFKRAVFLGGGPLYGTATEGHLKLQELTDGQVICKNDSYLGFRHGPKAVIDPHTLVVYTFSNDKHAQQYEKDLVGAMKKGNPPLAEMGIAETAPEGIALDHLITLSNGTNTVDEEFLTVAAIVPAQLLGFFKSLQLGLKPDAPSATGAITRVVEGVQIYALNGIR
ncbi:SIS domain-containing protein [Dawidia soli]|uniref:SIS domain-containing protein n=1 Tax=Dawidia soli TaxID=2782352 RepID=A0AAP2DDY9_9BACT|nr:SIS domain-containing protein [Dawidia soli]MBT1689552.1 SIS domain-containing protein [Dawidia soli]